MKTKLNHELAAIAPNIALETIWEHDKDATWDIEDPELDPDNFWCWQSEVRASAIVGGEMISGSACLCGTWEKFGDHPAKSNPEISGYLPQMIGEAVEELKKLLPKTEHALHAQCELAEKFITRELSRRYNEQNQAA